MWFVFDVDLVNWWIGFGVMVFLWLLFLGFRGRVVDGYDYCRRCGYCLEGLRGDASTGLKVGACVECGAVLVGEGARKGAVVVGRRVRRKGVFLWGVFVLCFCLGIGVGGQMVEDRYKPLGWLIYDLDDLQELDERVEGDVFSDWSEKHELIWDEIKKRHQDNGFSDGEVLMVYGGAIRELDFYEKSKVWRGKGGGWDYAGLFSSNPFEMRCYGGFLIERFWVKGRLDEEQRLMYLKRAVIGEIGGIRNDRLVRSFEMAGVGFNFERFGDLFWGKRVSKTKWAKLPGITLETLLKRLEFGGQVLWDETMEERRTWRVIPSYYEVPSYHAIDQIWGDCRERAKDLKNGVYSMRLFVEHEARDRVSGDVYRWEEVVERDFELVDGVDDVVEVLKNKRFDREFEKRMRWMKLAVNDTGEDTYHELLWQAIGFNFEVSGLNYYDQDEDEELEDDAYEGLDDEALEAMLDKEDREAELFAEWFDKVDVCFDVYVVGEGGRLIAFGTCLSTNDGVQIVGEHLGVVAGEVSLLKVSDEIVKYKGCEVELLIRPNVRGAVLYSGKEQVWGGRAFKIKGKVLDWKEAMGEDE